jgi:hypothetical protein
MRPEHSDSKQDARALAVGVLGVFGVLERAR